MQTPASAAKRFFKGMQQADAWHEKREGDKGFAAEEGAVAKLLAYVRTIEQDEAKFLKLVLFLDEGLKAAELDRMAVFAAVGIDVARADALLERRQLSDNTRLGGAPPQYKRL